MWQSAPQFRLYLVSDRLQTQGRDLLWVLEQALKGGVQAVQLREKDLEARELFALAEKTKLLCEKYRAKFLVNDRIDVALAVEADGVQIGTGSIPVKITRGLLGDEKLIGVSTHSLQEAQQAGRDGADFVLFGPVHFTPSKAGYGKPQGLKALADVTNNVSVPVYAIGGIKSTHVEAVRETGAHGVALISAVLSAPDPQKAAEEILRQLAQS
jgi:thiamine-phosphate pyrophosphorylase